MLSFSLNLQIAERAHSLHGDAPSCQSVLRAVPILVPSVDGQGTARFRSVLSIRFRSGAGSGVAQEHESWVQEDHWRGREDVTVSLADWHAIGSENG